MAQLPLTTDAGKDTVFCSSLPDSIELGGQPAASGGSGGYQFKWDIYPKPYVPYSNAPNLKYYASDFISDSSTANPLLIRTIPSNDKGPIYFILSVVDDSGNVAIDSVKYWWVNWTVSTINSMVVTYPGDTQTITPNGFNGGILPYTFDWGESPNIIGERYDYNVYTDVFVPSRQVIIPESPSPKWYGLMVTDSLGCSTWIGAYQGFIIEPVGMKDEFSRGSARIRVSGQTVEVDAAQQISDVSIFNTAGQLLSSESKCNGNQCHIQVTESGVVVLQVRHKSNHVENHKVYVP